MEDITKQLGNRIRSLRAELGISQEELAFKASISSAHLGQIERGLKAPTINTIAKIAHALNITLPTLFDFKINGISRETPSLNKITSYISTLTENEQNEILKIIKAIINIKNSN